MIPGCRRSNVMGGVSKDHFDNLPSPNTTRQGAEGITDDVTLLATLGVLEEEIE